MAVLPGRACRWPGCPEIVKHPTGYCEQHRKEKRREWSRQADTRRGSARQRGYDTKWEKFRAWYLNQPGNQYCRICREEKGRFTPVEVVHHIRPIAERPDLRLHPDNCMPLCRACHEEIHGRK